METFIILTRVSTDSQGTSGLGLEGQRRDIQTYLDTLPKESWQIAAELVEVESGGKEKEARPVLLEALRLAKLHKGTILVSRLDRLSRDVETIAGLMKRAKFRVASLPDADPLTLHIYASLSEAERKWIGLRTRSALRSARERGVRLGGLRPTTKARNTVLSDAADAHAARVASVALPMHKAGASLRQIAAALTGAGISTARGGAWDASRVRAVLLRIERDAGLPATVTVEANYQTAQEDVTT